MSRQSIVQQMLPTGTPTLWCPPLTHFDEQGLDASRINAQLREIAPWTRGWLVPGSTGEGWQLDDDRIRALLELVLRVAADVDARVLIGVLRQDAETACTSIQETVAWLQQRSGSTDTYRAMQQSHVCGFTVCPPCGAELNQAEIAEGLTSILQLDLPTALYQLPQVTANEMAPETVAALADQFPNFYLFKDTSGNDRVAAAEVALPGIFIVRGAEGDYARWLKPAGGPYDGFLLSTANVFAQQYAAMIQHLNQSDLASAQQSVAGVEAVVARVFTAAADVPFGNAFTNANKAIDHSMAFGAEAANREPPRLCDGQRLPPSLLEFTRDCLEQAGLLPTDGYVSRH